MNRLTIKNSDGTYSQATDATFEEIFNKCAEFEDFMEEQGFESLEQLKDFMQDTKNAMLDVLKIADRWQELKKYIETLSNESDTISEDLYFIKDKMQELEKDD